MKNFEFAKRILVLACLIVCQQAAAASDDVLLKAKRMVEANRPSEAYALLVPLQSQRAGEPDYDYVLGIAALDSGNPTEAIFALERFLTAHPDNGPARLELARAYFLIGEGEASRQEFEAVKRQQPPGKVNAAIRKYLSAINQGTAEMGTKIRGYVEMSGGHDTNVNSATSTSQIAIPALGGSLATLDPSATSRTDNFSALGAGVSVRHALTPAWALNANAGIGQRYYNHYGDYDIGNIDAAAGLTRTQGIEQYTGAVQYQKLYLAGSDYRQTYGLLGQWQHAIDDQRQLTTYGQFSRQDYQGVQDIRDANRLLLGGAYSQAFAGKTFPVIYMGAYAGRETPLASNVPQLSNNLAGVRFGGQLTLLPSTLLVASLSYEQRDYRGQEPGFLRVRKDQQTDVGLALSYVPAASWMIKPEITYTRNFSNIVLNDFSRTQFLLTVRRDFN